MKIVIPSHNRPNNVRTLEFIPESYYENTYIVTRTGEQEELYSSYKDKVNVLSFDCHNISSKRDLICRHFANEKIWMVDDDCLLYDGTIRKYKNGYEFCYPYQKSSEESFYEFIDYCSPLLDMYPHGIVKNHIFPKTKDFFPYKLNAWGFTNTMLNLKILTADDLDYNYSDHSEDVVAFLNTIDKGYQSFLLTKWMIKSAYGKPGGMTEIRTAEMQTAATKRIHKKFPQHTRLKRGWPLKDGTIPLTLIIRPKIPKEVTSETLETFME